MIIIVKKNSIENMELHFKIFHFIEDYLHKICFHILSDPTSISTTEWEWKLYIFDFMTNKKKFCFQLPDNVEQHIRIAHNNIVIHTLYRTSEWTVQIYNREICVSVSIAIIILRKTKIISFLVHNLCVCNNNK